MSKTYIKVAIRRNVLARDGKQCLYCLTRRGVLTFDHVVAEKWGGLTAEGNLVVACAECNEIKGVFPLDLFAEFLERRGTGQKAAIIDRVEEHLDRR